MLALLALHLKPDFVHNAALLVLKQAHEVVYVQVVCWVHAVFHQQVRCHIVVYKDQHFLPEL